MAISSPKSAIEPNVQDKKSEKQPVRATEEQLTYSYVLGMGRKIGLAGIIVAFVLYAAGILSPKVPLAIIPQLWTLPSSDYLSAVGLDSGWTWLGMLQHGDMLNMLGIAILGLVSIICYISIIPILLRKKDYTYVGIAVLEILVLALAVSGIIHVGE